MTYWILTSEGIKDMAGNSIDTPFNDSLVHHGQYGNGQLAVIVDRHQIWIFDGSWSKLLDSDIRLNCLLRTHQGLLVGTNKARLAWASDTGLNFITAFDELESRSTWSTPSGGDPDVRSLALDQNGTIYANIHVGWIVRSIDGGVTWEVCKDGLAKDVHMVSTHPSVKGIVYAATARGFHLSQDTGQTFEKRWKSFDQTYQRAIQAFVGKESLLVSVSDGPHSGNTKLYRSHDRGLSWTQVKDLPGNIESNINTYQITTGNTGIGFVIVNNSDIYKTNDHGNNWELEIQGLSKPYQVVEIVQ